jgi:hypothetical protein
MGFSVVVSRMGVPSPCSLSAPAQFHDLFLFNLEQSSVSFQLHLAHNWRRRFDTKTVSLLSMHIA